MRVSTKGDVLICKSSLEVVCTINGERHSNINATHISVTTNTTLHRTRAVTHDKHTLIIGNHIRQSLPHTLKSIISPLRKSIPTTIQIHVLIDNITGICHRSVNLSLTSLESSKKSLTALSIMAQECLIIVEVCLGGNSFVVDSSPIIRRHLALNNIKILAKSRQSLTIVAFSHVQLLCSPKTIITGLLRVRIGLIKPLSKQRNRLMLLHVLHVLSKLLLKEIADSLFRSGVATELIKHIIARILANQRNELCSNACSAILYKVTNDNLSKATLTSTATNVHRIAKETHSKIRILVESLAPIGDNLLFIKRAIAYQLGKHIKKSRRSSGICHSTIGGIGHIVGQRLRNNCTNIEALVSLFHLVEELLLARLLTHRLFGLRRPSLVRVLLGILVNVIVHNILHSRPLNLF